jgi:hypothetical protein
MVSTGKFLEKYRILVTYETAFNNCANGVITRQWGKQGHVCTLIPWSSTK